VPAVLRVALAEDSALLRGGLTAVLESAHHQVVAAVGDAEELREAFYACAADLVITDVRMPPTHTNEGLRVAASLRRERPSLPVLLLSQYTSIAYLPELLDGNGAGGIGYLLKDRVAHVEQFLDAVAAVAAGQTIIDPDVVRALISSTRRQRELDALTERERQVLSHVAEGLTNTQIADRLVVSTAAVRKHVGSIFAKLPLPDGDRRVNAVLTYLRSEA
jgi:DNA-binding NarL/FixJ family response regulator